MTRLALGLTCALGACSSPRFLIVTVDARPAVHDASSLTISLTNADTTLSDSFALGARPFPVTFSIEAPGRTGALAVAIDATDAAGLLVGHGSQTTEITAAATSVLIEATDFVVNTSYPDDQFPSDDFEASGFQLAALPDGTWTAVFRDLCPEDVCDIFGRRFSATGTPVATALGAGSDAFTLTTAQTDGQSTPAVASGAITTLAVWDAFDTQGNAAGVACRALDPAGHATTTQAQIAPDSADVVSVAALADGDFVATWSTFVDTEEIHAVIVQSDCTPAGPVQKISTLTGLAHRGSVAASADQILFAWIVDNDVHVRLATPAGLFATADTVLVQGTTTDAIVHARVAATSDGGFVLAARRADPTDNTGPGQIELYRLSATGALIGQPSLVTDQSASDADDDESFALASRADGSVLVAWHTCGALGDGNGCGVFGRLMRDTGEAVTDRFAIPTTTAGDQKRPSVVALPDAFVAIWSDTSAAPPDTAGSAVRARIIYYP